MRNQILIAGLLAAIMLPMFSNDAEARCRRRCRRACHTVSHCAPVCHNHCGNACHSGSCNVCNNGNCQVQPMHHANSHNNYPMGGNSVNNDTQVPQPMSRPNNQSASPAPPPPTPVR